MTFLPPKEDQKTFPGQVDPAHDSVSHPPHYTTHPSGVECIEITEHMNFCLGNAIKYIWRSGNKGDAGQEIEDLRKAVWYLEREIARVRTMRPDTPQVRVSGVPYGVDQEALRRMRNADDGD